MRPRNHAIGALLLCTSLTNFGCATDYPGKPSARDLALDLTQPEDTGRRARGQRGDDTPVQIAQGPSPMTPPALPTIPQPPMRTEIAPPPPPTPGVSIPLPPGTQQTAFKSLSSKRASVRAWVNGKPIFDDEIMLAIEMQSAPTILGDRERFTKAFNDVLNNIIDMEVAYQEAVKKLERGNPKALEKLKDYVDQDFDKQTKPIRKMLPPEKYAEFAPTFRRQVERQLIGMEYIRARVGGVTQQIGMEEIRDYYETHKNEFQKVATVKWQHVFIGLNAQRATIRQARDFAETLLDQVQKGGDFLALMKHDDGDAKTREGKGFGSHKGEIAPRELEPYLFEKMKPGQVGLLELSTGVHLFRLVEREEAGMVPFNEAVQTQIRGKIRNQIFDREIKRFVRELKARAVIEVEKGG
jgi:hypothetical protein